MSEIAENKGKEQGATRFGKIGLAIFLISFGLMYLVPNNLPDGSLFVLAGILIFIVTILNIFKGISYDGYDLLFATVAVVVGTKMILDLEFNWLYVVLVVVGIGSLSKNMKKKPKISNLSS